MDHDRNKNSCPPPRERVLVAMSGGVDSSLAAALLLERGCDVTGVFMCLGAATVPDGSGGCCSPQDADDARRVADRLGIGMVVLDLAQQFEPIIEQFVREYERGRTPNPCVLCNAWLKFGRLVAYADSLGVRYVATGHYARVDDRPGVSRGVARGKDQSYALFGLSREILGRVLLPIGEFPDKSAVRSAARERGLPTHDKPDSQEICFVPDDDYTALLRQRAPAALTPGEVVDSAGRVLGRHDGYARFTIGQRRGVRIAAKEPLYVTHIDPATARVTLGPRDQLLRRRLRATGANWHNVAWASRPCVARASSPCLSCHNENVSLAGETPVLRDAGILPACPAAVPAAADCATTTSSSQRHDQHGLEARATHGRDAHATLHAHVTTEFDAIVQIRYNHTGAPARVRITGPDTFDVEFHNPIAAITPGQAAVIYDDDKLLGGGWIESAEKTE